MYLNRPGTSYVLCNSRVNNSADVSFFKPANNLSGQGERLRFISFGNNSICFHGGTLFAFVLNLSTLSCFYHEICTVSI